MSKLISKIVVPDSSEATGYALYNVKDANAIPASEKGVASGVATLDSSGKVPSSQLPSYVDDVIEGYYHDNKFYATYTPGEEEQEGTYSDEITPELGKIYIDIPTNQSYRWSGSTYIVISSPYVLQLVDDNAKLGFGYYTCTTAGATAAKEVTAPGFVLKPNCSLAVLFTNAFIVTQDSPTLNINSTGAKLIKYYGNNIPDYVVKANTILTLVYDGTNYNVVNVEQKPKDDDLWVDLGLPSGIKWAKKNIDVTQSDGFAASEFQYDCSFFSWGNTDGYNPISTTAFDYQFGEGNYNTTIGSKIIGGIPFSQDAAHKSLGKKWRIPTGDEFKELIDNCDYIDANGNIIDSALLDKRVTINNIVGIYLQSKFNGKRIFFSACGIGMDWSWQQKTETGLYVSSVSTDTANKMNACLIFNGANVYVPAGTYRMYGQAIRPVQ